jgi:hypothetical protein
MDSLNKLRVIDINSEDKTSIYIMVDSQPWRTPNKISVRNLIDGIQLEQVHIENFIDNNTIIYDPVTKKIKVVLPEIKLTQNVINQSMFCESFNNHDVSYYRRPINASEITAMHAVVDQNYLYLWIEKLGRWKRVSLSEW